MSRDGARALRGALLVFAAMRLTALLLPSMALWGLNAGRFTSAPLAGALWVIPLLALIPAVGAWLDARLDAFASRLGPRPGLTLFVLAIGLLVFLLPDRIWFVGDFLLREGAMREPGDFRRMFPQSQPLDVLLHHRLPQWLLARGLDTTLAARMLGAAEAMLLAWLALRFARGAGLRGAAAFAVATCVAAGGYLALFAGYSKPTVELALLAVALGVFGVEMVRENRSFLLASLAFAAALGFHRSGLSLLPGVALLFALALRRHGLATRRTEKLAALIILVATLAGFGPHLWRVFAGFDLPTNFVSNEVRQQGGPLATAFSAFRLLDLANLVLLHVPLVLALPGLAWTAMRNAPALATPVGSAGATSGNSDREITLALLGLFAGQLPAILFVYVTQGPFRDWDAHAGGWASLALLVAFLFAGAFRAGRLRGLAAASALATLAATLTLIAAQHDLEGGLRRARAFVAGPPARTESQQLATLDFLGLRTLRLERFPEAAESFAALAERAPHPRALVLQGTASLLAGDPATAHASFERLIERDSSDALGWFGFWLAATSIGDSANAARAERRVLEYPDSSAEMSRILAHLEHYPKLWERMPRTKRLAR